MRLFVSFVAIVSLQVGCVSTDSTAGKPESSPQDAAQINYELGSQYLRQGNLKLARERLERAVEQDPTLPGPYTALALLYVQTGDAVQAENAYRRAIRVAPRDANVQNAFAVFLCNRGEHAEGQKYFLRAATNTSNAAPEVAFANAGVCALEQPDYVEAERHFRSALQRNPDYGDALYQMADLSLRNGNALSARAFLERYGIRNTPTPPVLLLCVQVENQLDDVSRARDCGRQLMRDFPRSPEARQAAGILNER